MRHLLSLLFGLVIAPAVWVVTGYGQARLAAASEAGLTVGRAGVALAVLAGGGLVLGLVAVTRLSPLGPLAAGLILLGGQLGYVARPEPVTELLPGSLFGVEGAFTLPAETGLAAVLGGMLLLALFSVGRWRRWPTPEEPEESFLSDAPPIGSPTPSGARRSYGSTSSTSGDTASSDEPTRAYGQPDEPTRRYGGGTTSDTDSGYGSQARYEPFGYVSDEPTRQTSSRAQDTPSWSDRSSGTRDAGSWSETASSSATRDASSWPDSSSSARDATSWPDSGSSSRQTPVWPESSSSGASGWRSDTGYDSERTTRLSGPSNPWGDPPRR